MRVTELPHVLSATEGTDRRGRVLRILTDLPLSPQALGHNAVKLLGLRKAIERIRSTEPYLKFDHFDLTNEGLSRALHARDWTRSPPGGWVRSATAEETTMAKGNKEAKKPKADKPKGGGSAYKLSQGTGGQAQPVIPPTKKK